MSELPINTSKSKPKVERDQARNYETLVSDILKVGTDILNHSKTTSPANFKVFGDKDNEYIEVEVGEAGIASVGGPKEKIMLPISLCVTTGARQWSDPIYIFFQDGTVKKRTQTRGIRQDIAGGDDLRQLEKSLLEAKEKLLQQSRMRPPGSGPVKEGRSLIDGPIGDHEGEATRGTRVIGGGLGEISLGTKIKIDPIE